MSAIRPTNGANLAVIAGPETLNKLNSNPDGEK